MTVRVLIVSPDTGFGGLIQQTLERSGRYEPVLVSTGRQALELTKQMPVDLAILDADTADLKLSELGPAMQAQISGLRILLIPSDDPDTFHKPVGMHINGYLTKPFYLPDLVDIVDSALTTAPEADIEEEIQIDAQPMGEHARKSVDSQAPTQYPGRSVLENKPWLGDNTLAAQHLARLSMSTSSQAALILRHSQLWAYAGQLDREAAQELALIVQHDWKPGPDDDSGSGERDVDLARFVHLKTTGQEHLLYATNLENDMLLVLAFDARTPFSEIRNQAVMLAAALASPPEDGLLDYEKPPNHYSGTTLADETPFHSTDEDDLDQTEGLGWALEFDAWQEAKSEGDAGAVNSDEQSEVAVPAIAEEHTRQFATSDQAVQQNMAVPISTGKIAREAEGDQESTQPSRVIQPQAASSPSVPAMLYDLHYACILVPRLPEHYLIGDLSTRLSLWMRRLSLAFGWRLEYLAVRPGWLQWIAGVDPDTSADHVIHLIRRSTSNLIFAEFPRYATENPSDDFWAPGFLVMTSVKPLPGDIVKEFIERTRQRQGIAGES